VLLKGVVSMSVSGINNAGYSKTNNDLNLSKSKKLSNNIDKGTTASKNKGTETLEISETGIEKLKESQIKSDASQDSASNDEVSEKSAISKMLQSIRGNLANSDLLKAHTSFVPQNVANLLR
jgi:hypothetical protein